MSSLQVLLILLLWVAPIAVGSYLGKRKGRTAAGVWLTVLLGVIGLVILAFLDPAGPAAATPAEQPSGDHLAAVAQASAGEATAAETTDSWLWR